MSSELLTLEELGDRVREALDGADLAGFAGLLAPDVRWGPP
jgi:hypothetical protein